MGNEVGLWPTPQKNSRRRCRIFLGKFDGELLVHDFSKILVYLESKGNMLFGQNFGIHEEDKEILLMLYNYLLRLLIMQKKGIDLEMVL